jgi:hypothetical protein
LSSGSVRGWHPEFALHQHSHPFSEAALKVLSHERSRNVTCGPMDLDGLREGRVTRPLTTANAVGVPDRGNASQTPEFCDMLRSGMDILGKSALWMTHCIREVPG